MNKKSFETGKKESFSNIIPNLKKIVFSVRLENRTRSRYRNDHFTVKLEKREKRTIETCFNEWIERLRKRNKNISLGELKIQHITMKIYQKRLGKPLVFHLNDKCSLISQESVKDKRRKDKIRSTHFK